MKILSHILLIVFLTIATQIGGIIYILSLLITHFSKVKNRIYRFLTFAFLYLITSFLIVPKIAPYFGRVKITNNTYVQNHFWFTNLCNRNYVKPQLNNTLQKIGKELQYKYPKIKLIYLDANFPFIKNFPLLPHSSHSDGKKIDLSFIYRDKKKQTNNKPSISGYGVFEQPTSSEYNQIKKCKQKGYWQYSFSEYLTFGSFNSHLQLDTKATKHLIQLILKQRSTQKVFIEPHLKARLKLSNSKIRFHGCKAVRHDDHIHLQIH